MKRKRDLYSIGNYMEDMENEPGFDLNEMSNLWQNITYEDIEEGKKYYSKRKKFEEYQ